MNRTELVAAVADRGDLTLAQSDAALRALAEVVSDAVQAREKVVIPGFLTVEAVHRSARTGRHPRTGDPLEIPATWTTKVTAGAALKSAAAHA